MSSPGRLSPLDVEEINGDYPGEFWDAEGVDAWNRPWVKQCSCGRGYYLAQWERLPLVGTIPDGDGGELELRDCACGSTIAIALPPAPVKGAARGQQ